MLIRQNILRRINLYLLVEHGFMIQGSNQMMPCTDSLN